jgi:hypothetical protein
MGVSQHGLPSVEDRSFRLNCRPDMLYAPDDDQLALSVWPVPQLANWLTWCELHLLGRPARTPNGGFMI